MRVRVSGVGLLLAAVLGACSTAPAASTPAGTGQASQAAPQGSGLAGEPIAVGAICAFSGAVNPDLGPAVNRGLQIAVDEINADGGIKGRPIKVITEDFGGQPAQAVDAAHKLIDVDRVPAVIFCSPSGSLLPVADYAKTKNVIVMNTASSSPQIRERRGTIFSTAPLDDILGRDLGNWIYDAGAKTVATMVPNNAYGLGVQDTATKAFEAKGGKVLEKIAYEEAKGDYRPELQRLLDLKPDAIITAPTATDGKLLFKQGTQLGMESKWYMLYPTVNAVTDAADANGRLFGLHVSAKEPVAQAFNAEYNKRFLENPRLPWAATSHDALWLIALAMRAGDTTADSIRTQLPIVVKDFSGATGKITWDDDAQRVDVATLRLRYENGALVAADQ